MPINNKVSDLCPEMQKLCLQHLNMCAAAGIDVVLYETKRDASTQIIYWLQDKMPRANLNLLRQYYGFRKLELSETHTCPTNTPVLGAHGKGEAYDLVPAIEKGGVLQPWWTAPNSVWKQIADIGVKCGLDSGYYWSSFKDIPHYQLKK